MKLPKLEKLRIVHYPDPVLKRVASQTGEFGSDLAALANRMLELMREAEGMGLAAPQVGVSIRLFVSNLTGEPQDDLVCVNPQFLELTGAEEAEEGCLSIPGVNVTMRRATRAVMEAFNTGGDRLHIVGEGVQARIWQHEIDHLDGRLIIDNMATSDEIANRRAIKQLKMEYATVH